VTSEAFLLKCAKRIKIDDETTRGVKIIQKKLFYSM
jgi:hypothetical protein